MDRLGVEIRTGSIVQDVTAFGVTVKHADGSMQHVPARIKIWAAGVQASPLGRQLAQASGCETDRAGRLNVLPDCTLPGYPNVFAVGDMMALDKLPGVAEVAMQSRIHAANTIRRRLDGRVGALQVPRSRQYGDGFPIRAIVSFKGIRLSGFSGWLMWLVVHITFLTGFKNRFTALLHWANTFFVGGRAERAITIRQAAGRVAIEAAGGDKLLRPAPDQRPTVESAVVSTPPDARGDASSPR